MSIILSLTLGTFGPMAFVNTWPALTVSADKVRRTLVPMQLNWWHVYFGLY